MRVRTRDALRAAPTAALVLGCAFAVTIWAQPTAGTAPPAPGKAAVPAVQGAAGAPTTGQQKASGIKGESGGTGPVKGRAAIKGETRKPRAAVSDSKAVAPIDAKANARAAAKPGSN